MEEAYDHLTEFHQLKAFEIIGELDEEAASSSSEEEWQDVTGQEKKKDLAKEKKLKHKYSLDNVVLSKAFSV